MTIVMEKNNTLLYFINYKTFFNYKNHEAEKGKRNDI